MCRKHLSQLWNIVEAKSIIRFETIMERFGQAKWLSEFFNENWLRIKNKFDCYAQLALSLMGTYISYTPQPPCSEGGSTAAEGIYCEMVNLRIFGYGFLFQEPFLPKEQGHLRFLRLKIASFHAKRPLSRTDMIARVCCHCLVFYLHLYMPRMSGF